jgi:hypothetical protein
LLGYEQQFGPTPLYSMEVWMKKRAFVNGSRQGSVEIKFVDYDVQAMEKAVELVANKNDNNFIEHVI